MEPVLITGADGFVGTHLRALLGESAIAAEVDVLDRAAVSRAIKAAQPRCVVHLAAQSSVASSWQDPRAAWLVNVVGTVNVLEAVREEQPGARILFVSTGEVYGRTDQLPTPESAPIAPLSPYAATKAAAEIACSQSARAGLDIVIPRAFNNEGPGRDERFALGSWAHQIARLEEAGGGVLAVGDLSAERDITDVRDVCRAYTLLLDEAVSAGTYNVASGRSVPMSRVVELFVSRAHCPVEVKQRDDRVRPVEIPRMVGDASRLRAATGWEPEIPLEQTIADMLQAVRATPTVA
jgi:GDP-4-dehydro-6-deoxy-D-mannose reductase